MIQLKTESNGIDDLVLAKVNEFEELTKEIEMFKISQPQYSI